MRMSIAALVQNAIEEGQSLAEAIGPLVRRLSQEDHEGVYNELKAWLPDMEYRVMFEMTVTLSPDDMEGDVPTHEEIVRKVAEDFEEATDYTTEQWFNHHVTDWDEN